MNDFDDFPFPVASWNEPVYRTFVIRADRTWRHTESGRLCVFEDNTDGVTRRYRLLTHRQPVPPLLRAAVLEDRALALKLLKDLLEKPHVQILLEVW